MMRAATLAVSDSRRPTIALRSKRPLQDDVRALIAELNAFCCR